MTPSTLITQDHKFHCNFGRETRLKREYQVSNHCCGLQRVHAEMRIMFSTKIRIKIFERHAILDSLMSLSPKDLQEKLICIEKEEGSDSCQCSGKRLQ